VFNDTEYFLLRHDLLNIIALFVIGLGASIAPLDFSVNVAFPAISEAFSLPTQSILWIPFSYVLTYGVLVIGFGALGDRLGHLRVFRAGLILAIIALTLCALAPDLSLADRRTCLARGGNGPNIVVRASHCHLSLRRDTTHPSIISVRKYDGDSKRGGATNWWPHGRLD
jgi:MFS family permease